MCEIANSSGCVCVCVHIIYSGLYTTTEVRIKGLHAAQQYRWIRVLLSSKTARQHFERKEPEGEPCPLLLHIFAFGTETAWTHCIKVLGARLGFDVPLSKWLAIGWYIKRREIKVKNKINKNVMNIREGEGGVAGKKERREEKVRLFLLRPANSRGLHLSWRPDATRMTQDWMTSFSFYNHPSHFPLPSFCLSSSVISSLYLISFLSFLFFSDSFRTHRRARVMDDF